MKIFKFLLIIFFCFSSFSLSSDEKNSELENKILKI